ncbi:MAG: universal stress protein, partial [Polyangiaceae bacterium]|nr:universal stress protein [Polyangiaceae bacterium]
MMKRPVLGCATDLGPSGDRAVAWSVALAKRSGAHVALLHAIDDPDGLDPAFLAESMNPVLAAYRARLAARKGSALERLDAARRTLEGEGVSCSV